MLNSHTKYDNKLPDPVGPIKRMLLFSSSTISSSSTSAILLPESPAGLAYQENMLITDIPLNEHSIKSSKCKDRHKNMCT